MGYPNGDGLTWSTKNEMITLYNLNIINDINNNEDNDNNILEKNTIEKNSKNNSFIGKSVIPQTRTNSLNDYPIGNKSTYRNYSKYSRVKRNCGNYNSNSKRYNSNYNRNKKGYIKKKIIYENNNYLIYLFFRFNIFSNKF